MFSILMALTAGLAWAKSGPITSGGGKVVVCESASGRTVELLDLYEAHAIHGWNIQKSGTVEEEGKRFYDRVFRFSGPISKQHVLYQYEVLKKKFTDVMRPLRAGEIMPETDDLGPPPKLPANCKIGQAVIYIDNSLLSTESSKVADEAIVNSELYDALSPQDLVALYFHELVYANWRKSFYSGNSFYVRRYVGSYFSTEPYHPSLESLPHGTPVYGCILRTGEPNVQDVGSFHILPDRLVFQYFFDFAYFSKTEGRTPRNLINEIYLAKLSAPVELKLESIIWGGATINIDNTSDGIAFTMHLDGHSFDLGGFRRKGPVYCNYETY